MAAMSGLSAVFAAACPRSPHDSIPASFSAKAAPAWTSLLDRSSGWIGADGIFTVPLQDAKARNSMDSTLLVFSDTMIGSIAGDSLVPGWRMVHNTVAYLRGHQSLKDRIAFYWDRDSSGRPVSMFVPRTPMARPGDYYWLGDGFCDHARGGTVYLFAYRIHSAGTGDFAFREVGIVLLALPPGSRPPFREQRQIDAPLFFSRSGETVSFGSGILVNTNQAGAQHPDGYVYVYGIGGRKKEVFVARVRPEDFEEFSRWRFWNGNGWVKDMRRAAPIADQASDELSVTALADGRYALVFQQGGMGAFVGMRIGAGPAGPFGPVIRLWDCPESGAHQTFYTYNAKAHPALSQPGSLVISYNVNAFRFFQTIHAFPHLYHPRFITVRVP